MLCGWNKLFTCIHLVGLVHFDVGAFPILQKIFLCNCFGELKYNAELQLRTVLAIYGVLLYHVGQVM